MQTQFSSAIFVNDALKLKLRQYVTPVHSALFYTNLYRLRLRHDKSSIIRELDEHDLERINAERRLLYCDIVAWRTRRAQHMPHVVLAVSDVQPDEDQEPEDICLFVPSDFTEPERQLYHLEEIARVELDLRMGEANDTIKELHTQINFKLGLQSEKKRRTKFTKDITRATKIVRDAEREIQALATAYRLTREAIVALGGDGKNQYPPLTQKDLDAKTIRTGTAPGKSKETESWVFMGARALVGDSVSAEEWDLDGALS